MFVTRRSHFAVAALVVLSSAAVAVAASQSSWSSSSSVVSKHYCQFPDKLDYRDWGYVSPVENQNSTQPSTLFAAAAVIEGTVAVAHHKFRPASTAWISKCLKPWSLNLNQLFSQIISEFSGLVGFPGENHTIVCNNQFRGLHVSGFNNPGESVDSLVRTLALNGPFGIAVDASTWTEYTGGIMNNCSSTGSVNHAAAVVGYDRSDPENSYWIVKNSWGTNWGENGYIRLSMAGNQCGFSNYTATTLSYDLIQ